MCLHVHLILTEHDGVSLRVGFSASKFIQRLNIISSSTVFDAHLFDVPLETQLNDDETLVFSNSVRKSGQIDQNAAGLKFRRIVSMKTLFHFLRPCFVWFDYINEFESQFVWSKSCIFFIQNFELILGKKVVNKCEKHHVSNVWLLFWVG